MKLSLQRMRDIDDDNTVQKCHKLHAKIRHEIVPCSYSSVIYLSITTVLPKHKITVVNMTSSLMTYCLTIFYPSIILHQGCVHEAYE